MPARLIGERESVCLVAKAMCWRETGNAGLVLGAVMIDGPAVLVEWQSVRARKR